MSENDLVLQRAVCHRYKQNFLPCVPDSKLGVALETIGSTPIHGLRHPPTSDTNGWYIWAGDYSDAPDFFRPLHASHLHEHLPEVIKYLGLPAGARFLLAGEYADVWFDASLLNT